MVQLSGKTELPLVELTGADYIYPGAHACFCPAYIVYVNQIDAFG